MNWRKKATEKKSGTTIPKSFISFLEANLQGLVEGSEDAHRINFGATARILGLEGLYAARNAAGVVKNLEPKYLQAMVTRSDGSYHEKALEAWGEDLEDRVRSLLGDDASDEEVDEACERIVDGRMVRASEGVKSYEEFASSQDN